MIKKLIANPLARKSAIFAVMFLATSVLVGIQVASPEPQGEPRTAAAPVPVTLSQQPDALQAINMDVHAPVFPQSDELDTSEPSPEQEAPQEIAEQITPAIVVYEPKGAVYDAVGFSYLSEIPMSEELQAYTYQRCQDLGLEYELILAIMWRESRFQAQAVNVNTNGTRDSGLMQINDVNRTWLADKHGISDLLDPYQNIDAGTAMLADFMSKYSENQALMAYQYGESGMQKKAAEGVTTNKLTELVKQRRDYYKQLRG